MVDHQLADRVVDDVDPGGAQQGGSRDAAQLGRVVDHGHRNTPRFRRDECIREPSPAELVDLDVDAHASRVDQRLEAGKRRRPAAEQGHLVGSHQDRGCGSKKRCR